MLPSGLGVVVVVLSFGLGFCGFFLFLYERGRRDSYSTGKMNANNLFFQNPNRAPPIVFVR